HRLPCSLGIIVSPGTASDDPHIVEDDLYSSDFQIRNPSPSVCRQYPPPVGISVKPRGLDQWRLSNGVRPVQAYSALCAPLHAYRDKLGGAFAVTNNGLRQGNKNLFQRAVKKRLVCL